MKNRIAVAIAALLLASLGTTAYAQQTPQPQDTPQQPMQPPMQQPMQQQATPPQGNQPTSGNGTASNRQVEQKIKHELTAHGVTATNVNVAFQDGTATLTGTVYSQQDIAKAKRDAMRVRGVKHVDTSGLQARASKRSSHNANSGA
jgi:hyperosmotically inducible protein